MGSGCVQRKDYNEAWRGIPGYDGVYQINFDGDVRTWRWRKAKTARKPRPMVAYMRGRGKKSRRRYVKLTDANGKSREIPVLKIMVFGLAAVSRV